MSSSLKNILDGGNSDDEQNTIKIALVHQYYDDATEVCKGLTRIFKNKGNVLIVEIDVDNFAKVVQKMFVPSSHARFRNKFYQFLETFDASAKMNYYDSEIKSALETKHKYDMDMMLKGNFDPKSITIVEIVNCGDDAMFAERLVKEHKFKCYHLNTSYQILFQRYVNEEGASAYKEQDFVSRYIREDIPEIFEIIPFDDEDVSYVVSKIIVGEKENKIKRNSVCLLKPLSQQQV